MKRLVLAAGAALAMAGCSDVSALGTLLADAGTARTFSGSVTGSAAAEPRLKVLAVPGIGSDPGSLRAQVASVVGGTFTVRVNPSQERHYTIFAFVDANQNGRLDAGEESSFGATGQNTYYQLSWAGDEWSVTEVRSSGSTSRQAATARLDIVFNS